MGFLNVVLLVLASAIGGIFVIWLQSKLIKREDARKKRLKEEE